MARIPTRPDAPDQPRIDRDAVDAFFEERARRIGALGPVRAVIYQDKHPDLAERRDAAEKSALLPLLSLTSRSRVLDIGCGSGRWTPELADGAAAYHGVDASQGLIDYARQDNAKRTHCRFTTIRSDQITLDALGEASGFDRIFCAGLFIYLNDPEMDRTFQAMADVSAAECKILLREPVGVDSRLTIKDHFSDDLDQTYNAIYRTQAELEAAMRDHLMGRGFRISSSGDVFPEASLNNRSDTRQRWILLERSA